MRAERMIFIAGFSGVLLISAAHFFSPAARHMQNAGRFPLVILSKPAAVVSYSHDLVKAEVFCGETGLSNAKLTNSGKADETLARLMPGRNNKGEGARYVEFPGNTENSYYGRFDLWEKAKKWINKWRHNPALALEYFKLLLEIRVRGASNLSLYDFALLAFEFPRLGTADFTITSGAETVPAVQDAFGSDRGARFTVEVRNASGRQGVALNVTRFLRQKGVDVLCFDNYINVEPNSKIIDRTGNQSASDEVRRLLGLDFLEIRHEPDRNTAVDVTIVIGSDFFLPKD